MAASGYEVNSAWASVPTWLICAIVCSWSAGVALVTLVAREACCGNEPVEELSPKASSSSSGKGWGYYKTHVV